MVLRSSQTRLHSAGIDLRFRHLNHWRGRRGGRRRVGRRQRGWLWLARDEAVYLFPRERFLFEQNVDDAVENGASASTVRRWTRDVEVAAPALHRPYRRAGALEAKALPPGEELDYLLGVICGDGNLWQAPRSVELSISCDAKYPELIETYRELIEHVIGKAPRVVWRGGGTYAEVRVCSKALPEMLQLPTGAKGDDYPIPSWIWDSPRTIRFFLRGLIETDGNIYHEYRNGGWASRCRFTAKNPAVMKAFLHGTSLLGYEFRRVGFDARLTRTAEVERLIRELDLSTLR